MAKTDRKGKRSARGNGRPRRQRAGSVPSAISHNQKTRGENSNGEGVLRLPDEILGQISLHFRLIHLTFKPFHSDSPNNCPPFYSWLVVTHICRRWREVALATPRMWATIELIVNTECVKTMLERSGQVPLTISEDTIRFQPKVLPSKQLVLEEMHRVRVLQITVDKDTCAALSKLSITDAPLLHTLDICYNDGSLYTYAPFDSIPEFSSWTLPSLARLAFHERATRLDSGSDGKPQLGLIRPILRPTLTHLEIDSLDEPISVDVCLDLLRTLPKLEKLALSDVLSSVEDLPSSTQPPAASRVVTLQYLREFSVQRTGIWLDSEYEDMAREAAFDSGVAAADLLRCLDTPASTSIHFTAGYEVLSIDALKFIFSVLRDKAVGTSEDKNTHFVNCTVHLSADVDEDFVFRVQLDGRLNHAVATQSNTGLLVPIDLGQTLNVVVRRRCHEDFDAALVFFTFGFPLSNILTMHWSGVSDGLERNYWPTVIQALPALQELSVKRSAKGFLYGMDQALRLASSSVQEVEDAQPVTSGTTHPVLSYLRALKVEDVNWCRHVSQSGKISHVGSQKRKHKSLVDQLIRTFMKWSTGSTDKDTKALQSLILQSPKLLEQTDLAKLESSGVAASVICPQIPLTQSEWCTTCHREICLTTNP